jgi:cysteine desulfurase
VRHYLDHAATTPMREVAREAWLDATARLASGEWANASSLHTAGRAARGAVEDARERIAAALGANPTEVIFTSGATEANNLAIKGLYWAARDNAAERKQSGVGERRAIVTSAVEHHAALDPARWLAREHGAQLIELPVGTDARVRLDGLEELLERAALLSVQWVNNETGTLQPLEQVSGTCHAAGVPIHSDAAQGVPHLPVNFGTSGLTTMAVSAHKLGGPVGVGALLARRDAKLTALIHGGGQERRIRSGTVDVAGARAFAAALDEAVATRDLGAARLESLRARLVEGIVTGVPDARVAEPENADHRAPHIVHLVIPGAPSEAMLFLLDEAGIAASSGSACTAGVVDASHVALAMGCTAAAAAQTLRLSLGHTSTEADVDAAVSALPAVVAKARATLR